MVLSRTEALGFSKNTDYPSIVDNSDNGKGKNNQLIIVKNKDGGYVIMTKAQLIEYIKILEKKRKKQHPSNTSTVIKDPYELGKERNGVRTIDVDSVTEPVTRGSSVPNSLSVSPQQRIEYRINTIVDNGQIDDFKQGKRGDCYLLAAIESIRNANDGQDVLAKNVKKQKDGSFIVTLPGAVYVRNSYLEQGAGVACSITGQYKITKEAIDKAKILAGKSYAYGDIETIALELAMEAYRAEVLQTNEALGQNAGKYTAGKIAPRSDSDTLSGGYMHDAIYLLTGQKSELYEAPKSKRKTSKLYIPGEYGYVGETNKLKTLSSSIGKSMELVEVEQIYNRDSDLQKMLDKYEGHEGEFSITVGVRVGKDGPDGTTKAGGGHALTVKKITDNYVEVVNPWDTTKVERIPRRDFEDMVINLTVAPVSLQKTEEFYVNAGLKPQNELCWLDFLPNLFNQFRPFFPTWVFNI